MPAFLYTRSQGAGRRFLLGLKLQDGLTTSADLRGRFHRSPNPSFRGSRLFETHVARHPARVAYRLTLDDVVVRSADSRKGCSCTGCWHRHHGVQGAAPKYLLTSGPAACCNGDAILPDADATQHSDREIAALGIARPHKKRVCAMQRRTCGWPPAWYRTHADLRPFTETFCWSRA